MFFFNIISWTTIIKEHINIRKRVDVCCRENNISQDSYYYWKRKIKLSVIKDKTTIPSPYLPKVVPLKPLL
jgi:hypothetical protein